MLGSTKRLLGRPAVMAAAFGGVVLGHWIGYRLVYPNPLIRDVALRATGHAYWPSAVRTAATLLAVALMGLAIRAVSARGRPRAEVHDQGPLELLAHLAALQMAGFTAMELTERLLAGAPAAGVFHHHLFPLGLLIQVAVAGAGALLLTLLARLARRAADVLSVVPAPRPRMAMVPVGAVPSAPFRRSLRLGGSGRRGPPLA